jgi:predicted nucleic acid-binding protein
MREVIKRKMPDLLADAEVFIAELPYELIPSVERAEKLIRDPKDQPILNAAIVSGVDVILTGDKDFLSLDLDYPKLMTVTQFLDFEGVEL